MKRGPFYGIQSTSMVIDDVLRLKRQYVIPRFQREYCWETEDLSILWDDLIDNIIVCNNKLKSNEYFIGSLVLVGDEDNTTEVKRYIVDGQQRLTTFTIAFSVLTQIFRSIGETKLADVTHSYIVGEDNDGQPLTRLEMETPKPYFQYRIQSKDIDYDRVPSTIEEKRILNAYNFIEKKLAEKVFVAELENKFKISGINYLDALKVFRDQILNCKVIYVTVKSFEDAYMIFEVLNAKGKNLSPIDVIKNYLFSILTDEEPLDYAAEKWNNIREHISSSDTDLSVFYRHFWLSKYKFTTNKKLVSEFNKTITITMYNDFLNSLEMESSNYAKFSNPKQSDWTQPEDLPIFYSLHAFQCFGVTQIRSFLLALFYAKQNDLIFHKTFVFALDFLEYFHFIFTAITSSNASWLERRYSSYARKLRGCNNKNESKKCINDLISSMKESLPVYEAYEQSFFQLKYTSWDTQNKRIVQYALFKLERYLSRSFETQPMFVTIEHILPESTKTEYVGLLGNLLPLGEKLNSEIANKSFSEKKEKYRESNFITVRKFLEENDSKTNWTKDDIENRTKELAHLFYYGIWDYAN